MTALLQCINIHPGHTPTVCTCAVSRSPSPLLSCSITYVYPPHGGMTPLGATLKEQDPLDIKTHRQDTAWAEDFRRGKEGKFSETRRTKLAVKLCHPSFSMERPKALHKYIRLKDSKKVTKLLALTNWGTLIGLLLEHIGWAIRHRFARTGPQSGDALAMVSERNHATYDPDTPPFLWSFLFLIYPSPARAYCVVAASHRGYASLTSACNISRQ